MIRQLASSLKLFQIIKRKILQINDIENYFDSRKGFFNLKNGNQKLPTIKMAIIHISLYIHVPKLSEP
jgi:hypothetical protein